MAKLNTLLCFVSDLVSLMRITQNKYDLHNADKFKKLCDILNLNTQKICSPYQLFLLNNQGEQILY